MTEYHQDEYHHERVLRGIPRWLLREYLEDLGGQLTGPAPDNDDEGSTETLNADGWQATLTQLEDFRVGSLHSGQVRLTVTGDPDEVRGMLSRLAPRLFRGGG